MNLPELYQFQLRSIIEGALQEDVGGAGDVTTCSIVPRSSKATAEIRLLQSGRLAGLKVAEAVFSALSDTLTFEELFHDGQDIEAGQTILRVTGPARALLTGERVALNFLGKMCGIATATRDMMLLISQSRARLVCTRRTTPGLRILEKYAVKAGGGASHRFGLEDGILIKENHLRISGGITEAVRRARLHSGHMLKIEVEVKNSEQLEAALEAGVDAVLLEHLSCEDIRSLVSTVEGRLLTEASGGITPDNLSDMANTGVDLVSMGWLTHSAPALDLTMELIV